MTQFYKLLAEDLCHNSFTYKEGLNVDILTFNPCGSCNPGGLYYTSLEHLPRWCSADWPLIANVTVPADAQVYPEPCGTKWKADRIELSNIRLLCDFFLEFDQAERCAMMKKNPYMLKFMPQTEEICLAAVRKNGLVLGAVINQTDAVCLAAVQHTGAALYWVRNKTDQICMAAVQSDGYALQYVPEQTEALCLAAVNQNAYSLRLVNDQTEALCLAAVQLDGCSLCWVRQQTEEICLAAVRRNGFALDRVLRQTEAICRAAVAQCPAAKCYVKFLQN